MQTKTNFGNSVTLFVITLAISAGCTSETGPTQASPNQESPNQMSTTQASTVPQGDFSQVTHADVMTKQGHWTSGADADGIIVYPALEDVKGADVTWSGYTLPVDIQIYSTKFDSSYNEVKGQLVYQGSGTISSCIRHHHRIRDPCRRGFTDSSRALYGGGYDSSAAAGQYDDVDADFRAEQYGRRQHGGIGGWGPGD